MKDQRISIEDTRCPTAPDSKATKTRRIGAYSDGSVFSDGSTFSDDLFNSHPALVGRFAMEHSHDRSHD